MRILVTGISGQVGGALLPLLRAHDVIAADRATLDLGKPERIGDVLDRLAPEFIINPAAYTAVDKAEDERDVAMRVNAEAPGAIARWVQARGVPFIHFSTDYVFDGSGAAPWCETDAARPLSVYGSSKLAGENAIRAAGGNSLIIRASWVYAARGVNFLRTILRLAQERKELRIVDDQIGAPTSASAVAEAVATLISGGQQRFAMSVAKTNGILHLAASGETSWYGFANAIIEGLKARGVPLAVERVVAIPSEAYPTRAMRPRNSRLDLMRMRGLFGGSLPGWRDMLDLELDKLAAELSATRSLPPG
ncbi:dTDP-4-dehydrorhamnose reductase [Rhodoplanes sp. Z2-YC6860]|nr:dTDP-4-dehydrorhamnose reductase [Rhodoplanes sp. Z2-YC6860]AMN43603.1 dTDP-4-dehydrorhamnose reductase [Rhodoplanes sp. Z2-YC6860]